MEIRFTNQRKVTVWILVLMILFLIEACAASKHSSQKLTEAEDAIREIEQVEAMSYAQVEFKEAQTKLEEARQLAEKGKHKKAILKAEEAEAVAEVAEVKTLSQKADESLSQLNVDIQSLKDRLEQHRKEKSEGSNEE